MRLKIVAAIAAIGVGIAGAAVAMDSNMMGAEAITARQDIMKSNGAQMKVLVPMAKGEQDFDAAAAKAALETIASNMEKFPTLFPEDSMEGGETRAMAVIWEKKADFDAAAAKLVTDATAAAEATAQGQEAFAAAFGPVGGDCGSCHEAFRAPKS